VLLALDGFAPSRVSCVSGRGDMNTLLGLADYPLLHELRGLLLFLVKLVGFFQNESPTRPTSRA